MSENVAPWEQPIPDPEPVEIPEDDESYIPVLDEDEQPETEGNEPGEALDEEEEEGDVEPEAEEGAEEEPEEETPRTFTLKRGDKQYEKTEEEVIQLAQRGLDSDERYHESKKMAEESQLIKQQAEVLYEAVQNDPIDALRQIAAARGLTDQQFDDRIFPYLQKKFGEYVKMREDPQEAERTYQQREAQRLREENERLRRQYEERHLETQVDHMERDLLNEAKSVAEQEGLPLDEDAELEVVQAIVNANDLGKDLTVKQAVAIVNKRRIERRQALLKELKVDDLDPAVIEEVKKRQVEEAKQRSKKAGASQTAKRSSPTRKSRKKTSKTFAERMGGDFL